MTASHVIIKRLFPKLCLIKKKVGRFNVRDVYSELKKSPNDFKRNTGVTLEEFHDIVKDCYDLILLPRNASVQDSAAYLRSRPSQLNVHNRLLLVLMWLKGYHKYTAFTVMFGVLESFVSREIYHLIPILYWRYQLEIH
jgi:hypothetical protein